MTERLRIRWLLYRSRPMPERGPVSKVVHKVLIRVLWPYYRRMPEHFHDYGPWKAFTLLCEHLRHADLELEGARRIEGLAMKEAAHERRLRIHAEARLLGVDEGTMKHINSVFGTDFPEKKMD